MNGAQPRAAPFFPVTLSCHPEVRFFLRTEGSMELSGPGAAGRVHRSFGAKRRRLRMTRVGMVQN
jgi:hypothetical protein